MAQTALAYELRPLNPPVDMRTAAAITCSGCGAIGKVPILGFGNNPDKIERAFIRMSWRCDVHKPAECLCPKCMREKAIRAKNDTSTPKEPPVAIALSPFRAASSPRVVEVKGIRDLTPEQKFTLRQLLDHSFDDKAGRYLDGANDHLFSEKTGIPRAVVVEFRELMFGPLKEDPLITGFRDQLDAVKKQMALLQSSIGKMELQISEIAKKNGM